MTRVPARVGKMPPKIRRRVILDFGGEEYELKPVKRPRALAKPINKIADKPKRKIKRPK